MPRPERGAAGDPREWLNRARSSIIQARQTAEGIYLEDLCFCAQQAAEKAIKAILIANGIEFPFVHDLGRLLSLLESQGVDIPAHIRKASRISNYAVASRYPLDDEPTNEDYAEATSIAEMVVQWAEVEVANALSTRGEVNLNPLEET
jgi:HEPN domain-containing protein